MKLIIVEPNGLSLSSQNTAIFPCSDKKYWAMENIKEYELI
jgi:hypothetical protein